MKVDGEESHRRIRKALQPTVRRQTNPSHSTRIRRMHLGSPSFLLLLGVGSRLGFRTFASSRQHPIGLKNLGNTCYLNSQLQCHFHIPRVRQLIMEEPSSITQEEPSKQSDPAPSTALRAMRRLFRDMHQSAEPVRPAELCRALGINPYEQQDSQEFWKLLLPAMNLPTLTDLYQGAYVDYIVALDGSQRERRREEPFLDLSLEVRSSGSLEKALESLFGPPELLSEAHGNGWRPEKGAPKVDAHKGSLLTPDGLPSILQVHLKRFQYDWNTDTTSKLNDPFDFPLVLDMGPICKEVPHDTESLSSTVYDLQSVVVHVGEYGSGHYYAYIRPSVASDQWYRFNDHEVVPVSWEEVLVDATNKAQASQSASDGFLARMARALFSSKPSYGYGGRTSSAYVLQYVRRSDLPILYSFDS